VVLRAGDIDHLVLAGIATSGVGSSTVRSACLPGRPGAAEKVVVTFGTDR
jgi:nicotinamidase-related amidase